MNGGYHKVLRSLGLIAIVLASLAFGTAFADDNTDLNISIIDSSTQTPTPTEGPDTPTQTPTAPAGAPTQAPAGDATTAPITALPVTGASAPDAASWLMPAALLIGGLTLMGSAVVARRSMRAR